MVEDLWPDTDLNVMSSLQRHLYWDKAM